MDKLLLRPNEVADALGLGRSKTYELILRGELPSVRIGKSVRVPREALEAWVRQRVTASGPTAASAADLDIAA